MKIVQLPKTSLSWITALLVCFSIKAAEANPKAFEYADIIQFAEQQYEKATSSLDVEEGMPRNNYKDGTWRQRKITDWTSGFFPGTLWFLYDLTGDEKWEAEARKWSEPLKGLQHWYGHHDTGFMVFCSIGNGLRLTDDPQYKPIILNTAKALTKRYNPKVQTIKSWGRMRPNDPQHITIIDNMINLEMLMWAAKNGGDPYLAEVAIAHADTTAKHHFRPDGSTYHLVHYNPENGDVVKKVTNQGYADDSDWARGQAWAIYGFTMMYRETGDEKYLQVARKTAEHVMSILSEDMIPVWDFDAPEGVGREKDASSACILASAYLEIFEHTRDLRYFDWAIAMLNELSTDRYLAKENNYQGIILHSVGNYPRNTEIDEHVNYADYYYLEAIARLKRLEEHGSIFAENGHPTNF